MLKLDKKKERAYKIGRGTFWVFLIISLMGAYGTYKDGLITEMFHSNFYEYALFVTFVILLFPCMFFYLAFYRAKKKGFKPKNYANAQFWLIMLITFTAFIPIAFNLSSMPTLLSCPIGKKVMSGKCCTVSYEFNTPVCKEEFDDITLKLESAINKNSTTDGKTRLYHHNPSFSFLPPKDYLFVENVEFQGLNIFYDLVAYGKNENSYIEIKVAGVKLKKSETFEELRDGAISTITKELKHTQLSQDIVTTNSGLTAYVYEYEGNDLLSGSSIIGKVAFIYDSEEHYFYGIYFTATRDLYGYVYEFEEVLNSFRIEISE